MAETAAGAAAGLAIGMAAARHIESLLYQARLTDFSTLALASLTTTVAALLAALPDITRAVRLDPVKMLRSD